MIDLDLHRSLVTEFNHAGSVNHLINHALINERREKNPAALLVELKITWDALYVGSSICAWAWPALSLICIHTKHDLSLLIKV